MTNITLSEAASEYIQQMIVKQHAVGFRLSIKKTGCSGYSYFPAIVSEINSKDVMLELSGVKIFLDATWLHLLDGVQIDYAEENKSGLKQKKLIFNNPNESSRCGCGESFHIE